jgi:hypothetical protein
MAIIKFMFGCAVFAVCMVSIARGVWGIFFELTRRR